MADFTEAELDYRERAMHANMAAAGAVIEESAEVDYFAFAETHKVVLPDGKQWVEIKELNEGEKCAYQNSLSREARVKRGTGDTFLKMAPGDERKNLLKQAVCGWSLRKGGVDFPFNPKNVDVFLTVFPPKIIDVIEREVRKSNPWLLQEMSVEDIEQELANLTEMLATKKLEEEGNVGSSGK